MSKKKQQKYYVVRKGRKTGIYDNWDACKEQVHGYMGAKYKSFDTLVDAEQAFANDYEIALSSPWNKASVAVLVEQWVISLESICVDAACEWNPGILERRGVKTDDSSEIFHSRKYPVGTVNIGEWLALIQWMQRLVKHRKTDWIMYSDSRTAMSWIKKWILNTSLHRGKNTELLRQAIDAGKQWLYQNKSLIQYIKIVKWKTSIRGEIPADFGRK